MFAGQRLEGFYVDLGSIFDLGDLRPFENLHIGSLKAAAGVNGTNDFSVHSIALKVPKRELDAARLQPDRPDLTTVRRRRVGRRARPRASTTGHRAHGTGRRLDPGVAAGQPAVQRGDRADGPQGPLERAPAGGRQALRRSSCSTPSWPGCCPSCIRACSRTSPTHHAAGRPRGDPADGHPVRNRSRLPELHREALADMLRLNLAIPPAQHPERAGDPRRRSGRIPERPAGVRRRGDRRAARDRGRDHPAREQELHADGAASLLTDGLDQTSTRYLSQFPYLGTPQGGYQTAPLGAL